MSGSWEDLKNTQRGGLGRNFMGRQGSQTAMVCIYFKESQQPASRMSPRTNMQQTVGTKEQLRATQENISGNASAP